MAKETKKQEIKKAQPARALSPFEEMEQMFDQYLRGGWLRPWRVDWPTFREPALPEIRFPKIDVVDREDEVVVKAEVPGVEKKDLDISVSDDSVTIKGTTSHEEKEESGDYYRSEISRGSFSRTVALPASDTSDCWRVMQTTRPRRDRPAWMAPRPGRISRTACSN